MFTRATKIYGVRYHWSAFCFSTMRIRKRIYIVQRRVWLSAVVIMTQPPRCDGGVALPMDSRGGMATTNKREKTDFCHDFWQVSHDGLPLSSPHSRNRIDIYDNGTPKSPASSSRYNFTRRVFRWFASRHYQRLSQLFLIVSFDLDDSVINLLYHQFFCITFHLLASQYCLIIQIKSSFYSC